MTRLTPHCPIKYGFDGVSPPPDVPEAVGGKFTASFDKRLWMFHRSWEPPTGETVRATLMIVHGTVDHSGVYDELAKHLMTKGIAVFAIDMRGWGLSDGESMYIDSIDTFCEDLNALYQQIHSRYETVKARFLLGKSIGGTVTAFAAARYPSHWTGLIGLSGAYQLDPDLLPSKPLQWVLHGLSWLHPKLPVKHLFDDSLIVSDPQALQQIRDDKLCCKDRVRVGYIVTAFACLEEMSTIASQLSNLPMLMMYGDDDQVVTLSGHQLMINNNQNEEDTKLKVYPGVRHNLLQEPSCKEQVMQDIQDWIITHS